MMYLFLLNLALASYENKAAVLYLIDDEIQGMHTIKSMLEQSLEKDAILISKTEALSKKIEDDSTRAIADHETAKGTQSQYEQYTTVGQRHSEDMIGETYALVNDNKILLETLQEILRYKKERYEMNLTNLEGLKGSIVYLKKKLETLDYYMVNGE